MIPTPINPFFEKNNIAVFFVCSDMYAPYCCVALASMLRHISTELNYDIIILCNDLTENGKNLLRQTVMSHKENVSLRFYNTTELLNSLSESIPDLRESLLSISFLVPYIFENYEKVLRLGADTLIKRDVGELFRHELHDKWLAACRDLGIQKVLGTDGIKNYYERELKMNASDVISLYFNSDVLLFNIKEWKINHVCEKLLKSGLKANKKKWLYGEQDVYNYVCKDHVLYINHAWNCFPAYEEIEECLPKDVDLWRDSMKEPCIVHFAGDFRKPWGKHLTSSFDLEWWECARQTSCYELLLNRLMQFETTEVANRIEKMLQGTKKMLRETKKMPSLKRKARLLATLRLFTFGKIHRRLKEKGETIRKRIEAFEAATQ